MEQRKIIKYVKGATIFLPGQQVPKHFYYVISGEVRNLFEVANVKIQMTVKEGFLLGFTEAISDSKYHSYAIAITDVALELLQIKDLHTCFKNNSHLMSKYFFLWSHLYLTYFNSFLTALSKFLMINNTQQSGLYQLTQYFIERREAKLASYCAKKYLEEHGDEKSPEIFTLKNYVAAVQKQLGDSLFTESIEHVSFGEGEFVYCDYEKSTDIYLVLEGSVSVSKVFMDKPITVCILGPGNLLGLEGLNSSQRSLNVITRSAVKLKKFSTKEFLDTVNTDLNFAVNVSISNAKVISLIRKKITLIYVANPIIRAYKMLAHYTYVREQESMGDSMYTNEIELDGIGIMDVLSMLGASAEEYVYVKNNLMAEDSILLEEDKITITNVNRFLQRYG